MDRFKLNVVNLVIFFMVVISLITGGGILHDSYEVQRKIVILERMHHNSNIKGGGSDVKKEVTITNTVVSNKNHNVINNEDIWRELNKDLGMIAILSKVSMMTILFMSIVIVFLVVLCETKKI